MHRILGQGGMGVVYEVEDPELPGRRLALKQLLPRGITEKGLARFEREALALAAVKHRGVVRIHAVGTSAEGPFLVEELVVGQPLSELVSPDAPCDPRHAAEIVAHLADAVAVLHDAGVLHRDLKPANVLLRPNGLPVLLDFGLARELTSESLTQSGELLGSPAYMAPEQAEGYTSGSLSPTTDVYGLGVILYALLTGARPFEGSPVNIMYQVLEREPVWPKALRPEVPTAIEAVVRKAMAKAQTDRHPGAAAFAADLRAALSVPEVSTRSYAGLATTLLLLLIVGVSVALSARDPAPQVEPARRSRTGQQVQETASPPLWSLASGERLRASFAFTEQTHHGRTELEGDLGVVVRDVTTATVGLRFTIDRLTARLSFFKGQPGSGFDSRDPNAKSLVRPLRHTIGESFGVRLDPRTGRFSDPSEFATIWKAVSQEPFPTLIEGTAYRAAVQRMLSARFIVNSLNALAVAETEVDLPAGVLGWRRGDGFHLRAQRLSRLPWPSVVLDPSVTARFDRVRTDGGEAVFSDGLLANARVGESGDGPKIKLRASWTWRFVRLED